MKSYFELLERYVNDHKDSFEHATANTVLETLFGVYSECNCMDTDEIKTAFAVFLKECTECRWLKWTGSSMWFVLCAMHTNAPGL